MVMSSSDMDRELSTTISIPKVRKMSLVDLVAVYKPDKRGRCKEH